MNRHIFCFVVQITFGIRLSACSIFFAKNGVEMSYNVTGSDYCQTGENKVKLLFGISLSDCVIECGLRNHCNALSYNHEMPSCLLLRSTDRHDFIDGKCDYILKSDINIHKTPCVNECRNGLSCDLDSKECKAKECSFPTPINGKAFGNSLTIGSKVRYKCDYGKIEMTGTHNATCLENGTWSYIANCTYFSDCNDAFRHGYRRSEVFEIMLKSGEDMTVRCDMSPDTGGWLVIQRRINASDFYKTWEEYKIGFGDLKGNFWIGNEKIWALTRNGSWKLRIDLTRENESGYAEYSSFAIGNEASNYILSVKGYTGTIGDSLSYHNGAPFSTKDSVANGCAVYYIGAWWYRSCYNSNLNGVYGSSMHGEGIVWAAWKGLYESMETTEMKIKTFA